MGDLLHMLLAMVAGMVLTLLAVDVAGLWAGAVTAGAAGWVMAQYDHNYKRVRGNEAA